MPVLSYTTAGESHGPALVTIISGLPAGIDIDVDFINANSPGRQGGYGRGGRQNIEDDKVEVLSGCAAARASGRHSPSSSATKTRASMI
jgi:chorismate synthase